MLPIRSAAAVAIAGAALAAASGAFAEPAKKHVVTIENMRYEPASLVVKKGESITWVNKDIFPHTVSAAGKFDSKEIAPNARWIYRSTKAGEFSYICTLHPNMKATLKVE
jgi:plastocyanin